MIVETALILVLSAASDSIAPRSSQLAVQRTSVQRTPPAQADRWFAADKVKHFLMTALIQSSAYSLVRSADASRSNAQIAASVASVAFGVAKEIRDRRQGQVFSAKDLIWDGAGALAAAALLNGTR